MQRQLLGWPPVQSARVDDFKLVTLGLHPEAIDLLSKQLTCSLVTIIRLSILQFFSENSLFVVAMVVSPAWPVLSLAEVASIVTPHLIRDHVILHTRHDLSGTRLSRGSQMEPHHLVDVSLADVSGAARVLGQHDLQGGPHPSEMSEEIMQGGDASPSWLVPIFRGHLY